MSVVARAGDEDDDPFQDLDANQQLQDLIAKTLPTQDRCSLEEYIGGDSSLSVCIEMDDNSWEDTFLATLSGQSSADNRDEELAVDEQDESEDDMEDTQVLPKLKSFREAIQSLEDVRCFLQSRGCTSEAISTGTMIDNLVSRVPSATQTTLHDYYPACQ